MRIILSTVLTVLLGLFGCATIMGADETKAPMPTAKAADSVAVTPDSLHFVAYYFYTNVRCPTCRKLEAYSQEAVDSGFVKAVAERRLEFCGVNTDDEENAHFLKDYQLITKSLVLVAYDHHKQVRWKNLEKIWELVGDKPAYLAYVRSELDAFMAGKTK